MKEVAEDIVTLLIADAGVNALVGSKVYWEMGKQNEQAPIVAFALQEVPESVDGTAVRVILRCFGEDMDQASDVYAAVKLAMKSAGHYFLGAESGITDDEKREGVIEVNYQLK